MFINWQSMHDGLKKALKFAERAHNGQYRKGTNIPYIGHPVAVAETLIKYGMSDDIVIGGLLHDTVENTSITLFDICCEFGDRVALIVEGCTEPKTSNWEERKKHTLNKIKTTNPEVLMVMLADKFDNIKSINSDHKTIGDVIWNRFSEPETLQKWYYTSLVKSFEERMNDIKVPELFEKFKSEVEEVFGAEFCS